MQEVETQLTFAIVPELEESFHWIRNSRSGRCAMSLECLGDWGSNTHENGSSLLFLKNRGPLKSKAVPFCHSRLCELFSCHSTATTDGPFYIAIPCSTLYAYYETTRLTVGHLGHMKNSYQAILQENVWKVKQEMTGFLVCFLPSFGWPMCKKLLIKDIKYFFLVGLYLSKA